MEEKRLRELISKYHNGQCTEQEYHELQEVLADPVQHDLLENYYDNLQPQEKVPEVNLYGSDRILKNVWNDNRVGQQRKARRIDQKQTIPYYKIAVAVLLILGSVIWWYPKSKVGDLVARTGSEVVHGQDRAQIQLDDGRIFDLDSLSGGAELMDKGFYLTNGEGKEMVFRYSPTGTSTGSLKYHTLSTPKGGQFKLELPDGTLVWLNAESKVSFPAHFLDRERIVKCEGEVYFEVAKRTIADKQIPFKVITKDQELEVLGTTFNISSYGSTVVTTLVEGRVSLKDHHGQVFLEPNQQAVFDKSFEIKAIDPMYAVAWKDGDFAFHKSKIGDVMAAVSRWYNVEVHFEGDFSKDSFTGTISKYENIDKLLETIALTGSIKFSREGRVITVKK